MKRTVAIFKDITHDFDLILECDDGQEVAGSTDNYVRISECVTIDFADRARNELLQTQLAALDNAVNVARDECNRQINKIEDARRKLLALPMPDEA